MKKTKLFLSMLSLCFALAVLCFGVYAANQVNYSISGNISYSVTDAYVDVTTSIYAMKDTMSRLDVRNALDDMCGDRSTTNNITEITSHPQKYEFVKSESWSSVNSNSNTYNFGNLNISGSHGYFFVFSVKKASSDTQNVWVAMGDNVTESSNTFIYDNMFTYNIGLTPKTFVVGVGIADPTQNINPAENISFDLEFGTGTTIDSIASSDWNMAKLDYDDYMVRGGTNEDGDEDFSISGLVVIPTQIDGALITEIVESGFDGYCNIREVYISNLITTINDNAFSYCDLNFAYIPSNVISIGRNIFSNCGNLISIEVDEDNTIYKSKVSGVEYNCIIKKEGNVLISGCNSTIIPFGIQSIGEYAFCGSNIAKVEIPSSVTNIGEYAFLSSGLLSITIPSSLESIGRGAFSGCTSIASIFIPSNVITMGEGVFDCWTSEQIINVQHPSKPNGWNNSWDRYDTYTSRKCQLFWGVSPA